MLAVAVALVRQQNATEVVLFHADYPSYESAGELASEAEVNVEVRFTGKFQVSELEPMDPINADDPVWNPQLGVEKDPNDPETPPIYQTEHEAIVLHSSKGNYEVGDRLLVRELGGLVDGVEYKPANDTHQISEGSALGFFSSPEDGVVELLNPEQSIFELSKAGAVVVEEGNELIADQEELSKYVSSK